MKLNRCCGCNTWPVSNWGVIDCAWEVICYACRKWVSSGDEAKTKEENQEIAERAWNLANPVKPKKRKAKK